MSAFNMALTCVNTRAIQRLEVTNFPVFRSALRTPFIFMLPLPFQAVVDGNTRKLDSLGDKIMFTERCLEDISQCV
jgi:hypothetical protein